MYLCFVMSAAFSSFCRISFKLEKLVGGKNKYPLEINYLPKVPLSRHKSFLQRSAFDQVQCYI